MMKTSAERTSLRQPFLIACLGLAFFTGLVPSQVNAQQRGPNRSVYVVTQVDLAANGERLAAATKVWREFAAKSQDRKNIRFRASSAGWPIKPLRVVDVWQTREVFEAHSSADHAKRIREELQPVLGSPFDERLHALFAVTFLKVCSCNAPSHRPIHMLSTLKRPPDF